MEPPNIEPDIMNVHYPDYYSKNKNPTDDQNPNPIIFLTIKNTKFKFLLGSKDENLLEKSKKYLSESLSEHGIGAKTAVGYGLWSEA
jgi:CRISPR-associated protein Cmr6